MLTERVDERHQVLANVVQVDLLEAQLDVLGEPGGVLSEIVRDAHHLGDVVVPGPVEAVPA